MTIKCHFASEHHFAPFTSDCTEQNYFLEPSQKLFENDLPTCIKINTTDRHSKDGTHDKDWIDYGHGQITYKDRLYIPADHNFAQTLSANTTILLPLDIQDDGNPGKHHQRLTGGHACKGQIRSTSLECDLCQRTKPHREKPRNPLHPHEVPSLPWEHISIDLITGLPESTDSCYSSYRRPLLKMILLVAVRDTLTSFQTAEIYRDHVWSKHGLPKKVISDRGPHSQHNS